MSPNDVQNDITAPLRHACGIFANFSIEIMIYLVLLLRNSLRFFIQTWILLAAVLLKNVLSYIFFLVLDIGLPIFEAIPLDVRFAIGVLQVFIIRAAGFATTSLSSLAPTRLVLCVILMYLGTYPVALSVRAANVYEEKTLGIFDEDDDLERPPQEKDQNLRSMENISHGTHESNWLLSAPIATLGHVVAISGVV
ncbi:hypothetical protein A7U60_g7721 [Sanghuangporus baumii]|uniref:Uncharacterized protein n=1 Tax=Sanghuangporus baumii TaxID=108892 RepID=A0A9Q5N4E8_SANBA|nr:hypothetical protein A7U60_g7721 [Sanghuangporus baumii]